MTVFIIAFVLSYLYHGFGITVGYHRLLSHKAFKVPAWLEYMIISGGYLALEGSPVSWVATHRVHHKYTDREGDPHKPADGFWHSWGKWLYEPKIVLTNEQIEQVCPDLMRDPVYHYLDFNHQRKHALVCLITCIAFRVLIFALWGPWAVLGNLLGTAMTFVGPFWVNSVCHIQEWGYRNFATSDGSRNVPWVGFWALGEGWHNNHHAVPQSARHGIKPYEIDISWMFIDTLRALGLATNVRLPKEPKLAPAIDPEFAALLKKLSDSEPVFDNEPEEIVMPVLSGGTALNEQINATHTLAKQVTTACDQLTDQVVSARLQLVDQLDTARDQLSTVRAQLVEQMITNCDQLAEQLTVVKVEVAEQVRGACEQLSDKLPLKHEVETASL